MEKGLCAYCSEPAWLGGVRCVEHALAGGGSGKRLVLRKRWPSVDWTLPVATIAKQLRVTVSAVYQKKRKLGIKTKMVFVIL